MFAVRSQPGGLPVIAFAMGFVAGMLAMFAGVCAFALWAMRKGFGI